MKTAIVTGACSAMGRAVCETLTSNGFNVVEWCRCKGVDLRRSPLPQSESLDAVVHIAETGVSGLLNVAFSTSKSLKASNGTLIAFSSIHHLDHDDAYAASKRAQEMIIRKLVRCGFRPNCLRLGHIAGTTTWPTEAACRLPEIPMGRFGTPEDVARTVLWMINSPWLSGSVVTLDGGISAEI